jgi:hypothetical protein
MPARSPADRTAIARIAAHVRWSRTRDRAAATAAEDRFTRQVDPDGALDPEVRARLAANARAAYFGRLSRAAAKARTTGGAP